MVYLVATVNHSTV